MFEESLLESAHLLRTQNRWPAFASVALQAAIATAILVIPLLRPGVLPLAASAFTIAAPAFVHQTPPSVQRVRAEVSTATPTTPAAQTTSQPVLRQTFDPTGFSENPPTTGTLISMAGPISGLSPALTSAAPPSPHVVVAAKSGLIHISQGVSVGLLLTPIQPVYPTIAKVTHTEGTVIIHALISKEGHIESASIVSGPALLQSAALDAVRAAHYRPYRLNGEPTEVETTFNINFHLGS